jgi:hypothetical protein
LSLRATAFEFSHSLGRKETENTVGPLADIPAAALCEQGALIMSQRLLTRSCPARCSKAVAGIGDSGRYLTEAAGGEAFRDPKRYFRSYAGIF